MRRFFALLAFLALLTPAHAFTYGIGCANPCGREEAVVGGVATCSVQAINDADFPVTWESLLITVGHASGDVTTDVLPEVMLVGPPPDGTIVPFEVPILLGDTTVVVASVGHFSAIGVNFTASFSTVVDVIPELTCGELPTTTTTSTSTTTTSSSTTIPQRRPCNPHANPNSRWCR